MGELIAKILIVALVIFTVGCDAILINKPIREDINKLSRERQNLIEGALEQINYTHYYDAAYVKINYPNGDVPRERGACSDVVVRAFRKAGTDLQQLVHEDMQTNFSLYPKTWGLSEPDTNIDHRRVPNLMKYFERRAKALTITENSCDYLPGDVVVWRFENNLVHTGVVVNYLSKSSGNHLIVHNIGRGAQMEDVLFHWKIIGHYRYFD